MHHASWLTRVTQDGYTCRRRYRRGRASVVITTSTNMDKPGGHAALRVQNLSAIVLDTDSYSFATTVMTGLTISCLSLSTYPRKSGLQLRLYHPRAAFF